MYEYGREVYYYETDGMRVVHHSNYIRWLEEARTAYFASIGLPYEVTESLGVMGPVLSVSARFRRPARFGESFTVRLRMNKYTGAKFTMLYEVLNGDGVLLCEAESSHGFLNNEYRPVSLARALPDLHKIMLRNVEN
jgi:acyl-CoA thioester hydrolase